MGSFGSISQTASSDLDTWICVRDDLTLMNTLFLPKKLNGLVNGQCNLIMWKLIFI